MNHKRYTPGAANIARIDSREGDSWALVVVRELRHSPQMVWDALTRPEQLREWAPFDASADLGKTGNVVELTTVGAPSEHVTETAITRADEPRLLEYNWGGNDMRWQLEPVGKGTRLTLWTCIDRRFVAMGAAGWHVCLDVMDRMLDGDPIGRLVAGDALQSEAWQQLYAEYRKQFETNGAAG